MRIVSNGRSVVALLAMLAVPAGGVLAQDQAQEHQDQQSDARDPNIVVNGERPALVTTGLLAFIAAWNEFLYSLTFTSSNDTRTVPVAISLLSGGSEHEIPWGNIMAASVIVTVPLVILVLIFQRKIISGLTAGGVKG